jgi:hypothetical protein
MAEPWEMCRYSARVTRSSHTDSPTSGGTSDAQRPLS